MLKCSKTFLLPYLFLSTTVFAAPTDHVDPLTPLDTTSMAPSSNETGCQNAQYCEPYGIISKPNIYGELAYLERYKDDEKIQLIGDYTKELVHSMYLLIKKVDNMAVDNADNFEGITYNLNHLSSQLAHHDARITETDQNLTQLSVQTMDELATLSASPPRFSPSLSPTRLAPRNMPTKIQLENAVMVKQLQEKLNMLNHKVAKWDSAFQAGFAMQAALSGLFQPDEKHRTNFTAALGGYHTQTAFAVGIGHRFNRHVATRTGVALSANQRIMYNTAINFVW